MEEQTIEALKVLETMKMTTRLGEGAPRSDHEFMRILQEGEAEHNLDKIYQFVEALERGRGLANDANLKKVMERCLELSPERVMHILAGKRHLERCVYLALCDVQTKISFVKMGADGNMEFLYECLRQLISFGDITDEKREAVVLGTAMLAEGSEDLWRRMLLKREYDKKWIDLLGLLLPELNERALVVYAENIHMNLPTEYSEQISKSIRQMGPERSEQLYSVIEPCIYNRWRDYLGLIRRNKSGLQGIFVSGYSELIYGAALYLYREQETWEHETTEILHRIEQDMVGWYSSVVQMEAVFFADMSELYLLLCVAVELGIHPTEECREQLLGTQRLMDMHQYLWEQKGKNDVGMDDVGEVIRLTLESD